MASSNGCEYESTKLLVMENEERQLENQLDGGNRPLKKSCCCFCRAVDPDEVDGVDEDEEIVRRVRKRLEANDPQSYFTVANWYRHGMLGYPVDNQKAFEHMHRAAELGWPKACHNLGCYYQHGVGTEKDERKEIYWFEEAAKKGDIDSRWNLGDKEMMRGDAMRAIKHFLISAAAGDDQSLGKIIKAVSMNLVTRDKFNEVRAKYHEAKEGVKSEMRADARVYNEWKKNKKEDSPLQSSI